MANKILLVFLAFDFIFLGMAGLMIGFALTSESASRQTPTSSNVATHLLLKESCPLTAAVVNAIFMFVTFLVSLPALVLPSNRGWLKAHGWMLVVCAIFTLVLGLDIWFETLQTRARLGAVWEKERPLTQSLLQQKFDCCGYFNSTSPPFVQDTTCTNSLVAAELGGCISSFSKYANSYLDLIFTSAFGIASLDILVLLCAVMVLKDRQEQERYRHIDEKNNSVGI